MNPDIEYLLAIFGCVCVGLTKEFGWIFAFILFLCSMLLPQIGATVFAVYAAIFFAVEAIRLIGVIRQWKN